MLRECIDKYDNSLHNWSVIVYVSKLYISIYKKIRKKDKKSPHLLYKY